MIDIVCFCSVTFMDLSYRPRTVAWDCSGKFQSRWSNRSFMSFIRLTGLYSRPKFWGQRMGSSLHFWPSLSLVTDAIQDRVSYLAKLPTSFGILVNWDECLSHWRERQLFAAKTVLQIMGSLMKTWYCQLFVFDWQRRARTSPLAW